MVSQMVARGDVGNFLVRVRVPLADCCHVGVVADRFNDRMLSQTRGVMGCVSSHMTEFKTS